ncbi:MAG TPA: OmpA family protein [Longimicrobium sp.]|jgi:flagellar motor protein MotB|nr:OmpA family protein [Longimicrobium sp.]
MRISLAAPTVDTRVNFWPALIDMLTSLLMFFLLVYFVERDFSQAGAELAIARQKQARFAEEFHREFGPEIRAGQVMDTASLGLLQIRFGDGVLFDTGEYGLRPQGQALLTRLAAVFQTLDAGRGSPLYDQVQIEGHTDTVTLASPEYPADNWELSTARALAVLKFLSRDVRPPLDEARLSANGYAHTRPIGDSRRNRRIEIRIVFSGASLPAGAGGPR